MHPGVRVCMQIYLLGFGAGDCNLAVISALVPSLLGGTRSVQCPPLDSAAEYGQRSAAFRLNKTLASNLRLNDASLSLALCALHSPDLAAGEQGIRFSLLACSAALYVRRRERQNVVSRKRVHRRSLSRMFQFDDQHMLQSALDLVSLLSIFPCSVIGFTIVGRRRLCDA